MSDQNSSVARARILGGALLLLAIVAINSICTQFVAQRLHYHPALGRPILGTLYEPFAWWRWMFSFYSYAEHTYSHAFVIFAVGVMAALLAYVLYVGFATRSTRRNEGIHGTAHFATAGEVQATGLLSRRGAGRGVYCGGYSDPESGRLHYLRHDGPEHVCALAPTRSGKGVGLVIPTLLSWPHSVFILDRKGENYAMTAGWRGRQAGQQRGAALRSRRTRRGLFMERAGGNPFRNPLPGQRRTEHCANGHRRRRQGHRWRPLPQRRL